MSYVRKGNSASGRHPFLGVDVPPQGPSYNHRTAEQVYEEAAQRKGKFHKVDLRDWHVGVADRVGKALEVLNRISKEHPEIAEKYGAWCAQAFSTLKTCCDRVHATRETGPGCVMVPHEVWNELCTVMAKVEPTITQMIEEIQPIRLVVPNGMSVEDAQRVGEFVESRR